MSPCSKLTRNFQCTLNTLPDVGQPIPLGSSMSLSLQIRWVSLYALHFQSLYSAYYFFLRMTCLITYNSS